MFFKNYLIGIFLRFTWFGILFGLFNIFCMLIVRLTRRNLYITNIVYFCFWLSFGGIYTALCQTYYNFSFCAFGLAGMFLGLIFVKIGIEYFFTKLCLLLYNKLKKIKKKEKSNGKLRTSEKS